MEGPDSEVLQPMSANVQVQTWTDTGKAQAEEHPEGDAIRRQVEFYFSDENLPSDSFLLGLCGGEQNLPVSISRICDFSKMRKYKPMAQVKESLRRSTFLELVDNKHIRRRSPLKVKPTVQADMMPEQPAKDKPWLTKGMLKPTGFEANFADAPLTPAEFAVEKDLYDPEISFETRIETAIQRYRSRRKFHQGTAHIFNAFLSFGGIESSPRQFTGGISKEDLEERDASEIAAMLAQDFVSQDVINHGDKWEVDFAAVARGFLSTATIMRLPNLPQGGITAFTNILSNFYRYIHHHNVCPEYRDQLNTAAEICEIANYELPAALALSKFLPDGFSSAISTIHDGNFAGVYSRRDFWDGADDIGWSNDEAKAVLMAGIAAYGTDEQFARASSGDTFETVLNQDMNLVVTDIEMANDDTRAFFETGRLERTFLRTLGKLHCSRLSEDSNTPMSDTPDIAEDLVFWVEEETLELCYEGLKIHANVRVLDIGIKWLDSVNSIDPSYYQLLANEFYDKEDSAIIQKEYLKRARKIKREGRMPLAEMQDSELDVENVGDGKVSDADESHIEEVE